MEGTSSVGIQNKTVLINIKNVNYSTNYPCNGIAVDTNQQVSIDFL